MCSRDPQHRGDQRASIVERIGKDGAIFYRQPQGAQGSSDRVGRQAVLWLLENLRSVIRAGIQFMLGLLEKARFAKPKLNGYECDHHDRAKAQSDNLSQRHWQYSTDGAGSFLLLLSQIGRKGWLGADSAGPSAGSLSSRQVPSRPRPRTGRPELRGMSTRDRSKCSRRRSATTRAMISSAPGPAFGVRNAARRRAPQLGLRSAGSNLPRRVAQARERRKNHQSKKKP